jgi:ABC-type transporter Mla subunit MlaD
LRKKLKEHESVIIESEKKYKEYIKLADMLASQANEVIKRQPEFINAVNNQLTEFKQEQIAKINEVVEKVKEFKESLIKTQEEFERKQITKLDDVIRTYDLTRQRVDSYEHKMNTMTNEIDALKKVSEENNSCILEQNEMTKKLNVNISRMNFKIMAIIVFVIFIAVFFMIRFFH